MKVTLTITEERFTQPWSGRNADKEAHTVADVTAEGGPSLIAGHLRAVADSIEPNLLEALTSESA